MTNLIIKADASPLIRYLEQLSHFLDLILESGEVSLDLSDLGPQIARFEANKGSASTGELVVSLYPSDALLRFGATVFAAQTDGLLVQ